MQQCNFDAKKITKLVGCNKNQSGKMDILCWVVCYTCELGIDPMPQQKAVVYGTQNKDFFLFQRELLDCWIWAIFQHPKPSQSLTNDLFLLVCNVALSPCRDALDFPPYNYHLNEVLTYRARVSKHKE